MKLGILTREETMATCSGKGCLNALLRRKDSFAGYPEDVELLTFTHSGGNLKRKIGSMRKAGITHVHLSTCLRAKSAQYEELLQDLSVYFTVVGYTHGPKVRKESDAESSREVLE